MKCASMCGRPGRNRFRAGASRRVKKYEVQPTPEHYSAANATETTSLLRNATYKENVRMRNTPFCVNRKKPFYFNTSENLLRIGRQKANNVSELLAGVADVSG